MADPDPPKPGDEAPPDAPGTGENLCRACSGKGHVDDRTCPECRGTGTVTTGIGGA
jgi:RecJ-like exonuclease